MREWLRYTGFFAGTTLFLLLGADLKISERRHVAPLLGEGHESVQFFSALAILALTLWATLTDPPKGGGPRRPPGGPNPA